MLIGLCSIQCTGDCVECLEKGESDMESEVCDIGHEEIVYFSGRCPLCEAKYRLEALNDTIPYRFLGTCYKCQRFDICTYPEKNVKPEHQRVLDRMNKARQSIKQKEKEIWNYKVLLGLPVRRTSIGDKEVKK